MRNMIKKTKSILIKIVIGFIVFVIVFAIMVNSIVLLRGMLSVVLYGIITFGFIGTMIFVYYKIMKDLKNVK